MNIGFIGAGKVGFTLGRYFTDHNISVSGYYSRNFSSAQEAAEFTKTKAYHSKEQLLSVSDALFLTVPDGVIKKEWETLLSFPIENKIFCHCSGALSSAVFSGINQRHAFGYSIHPLFAISDKQTSYKIISQAVFTIEGDEKYLTFFTDIFSKLGNRVKVLPPDCKTKYHSSAVFASNLVIGLLHMAKRLLMECGFDEEEAFISLMPMFLNNSIKLSEKGEIQALTGPVERNDFETVKNHIECFKEDRTVKIYQLLSEEILSVAKEKHPKRDYGKMERLLRLEK